MVNMDKPNYGRHAAVEGVDAGPCTTCGWGVLTYECFVECRDNKDGYSSYIRPKGKARHRANSKDQYSYELNRDASTPPIIRVKIESI